MRNAVCFFFGKNKVRAGQTVLGEGRGAFEVY